MPYMQTLCIATLKKADPLSRLVYSKTDGNALFTHQLLHTLDAEQMLIFDLRSGHWQWDIDALQAMDISDNVVDLMTANYRDCHFNTELLKFAACIGNQFDLATLAIITQESEEATQTDLQAALREGIIFPLNNHYKFAHDRVQQAAYSLISDADKEATHLEIGRLLQQHIPDQEQEEKIFDIVNHLNIGSRIVIAPAEQIQLAELNLMAGRKAKQATAYESAFRYFHRDRSVWPTRWENNTA